LCPLFSFLLYPPFLFPLCERTSFFLDEITPGTPWGPQSLPPPFKSSLSSFRKTPSLFLVNLFPLERTLGGPPRELPLLAAGCVRPYSPIFVNRQNRPPFLGALFSPLTMSLFSRSFLDGREHGFSFLPWGDYTSSFFLIDFFFFIPSRICLLTFFQVYEVLSFFFGSSFQKFVEDFFSFDGLQGLPFLPPPVFVSPCVDCCPLFFFFFLAPLFFSAPLVEHSLVHQGSTRAQPFFSSLPRRTFPHFPATPPVFSPFRRKPPFRCGNLPVLFEVPQFFCSNSFPRGIEFSFLEFFATIGSG